MNYYIGIDLGTSACKGLALFLFVFGGMWDVTSSTRDQTHTTCIGSVES